MLLSHSGTTGAFTRIVLQWAAALMLCLGVLTPVQAQAQVDWLVQINDAGFDPFPAGGTIEYQIEVSNNGVGAAPATTFDLVVPAGVTVTGAAGTITGCAPLPATATTLTCNVPPLASLGSADLLLQIDAPSQGFFEFAASVPTAGDSDPGNNANPQATTITEGSDITLTLVAPATAASGSIVPLVWTATNNGPDAATAMDLTFDIPTGMIITEAPVGCTLGGTFYTCDVGAIGVGGFKDLTFQAQISAGAGSTVTPVGSIVNVTPGDANTDDNTVAADIEITPGTDLAITKSRTPAGTLLVGDDITWTLSSSYTGESPSDIVLTDSVPSNYAITSVTPAGGSGWICDVVGQDISCEQTGGSGAGANIALGDIVIVAEIISAGAATNVADITASGPLDSDLSNNSDDDGGVTIQAPSADLQALKTGPDRGLVVQGQSYEFEVRTRNLGNADFTGTVIMTDSIPAGLTVTNITTNGWTCVQNMPGGAALPAVFSGPQDVACTIDYSPGDELSVNDYTPFVVFETDVTATGSISNSMTVSSSGANFADGNLSNNTATFGVTSSSAAASADVSLIKTAALATLPSGDVQTFELEIVNAGLADATTVELTDNFLMLINDGEGPNEGFISATVLRQGLATGFVDADCVNTDSGGRSRLLTCTIPTLPQCTPGAAGDCPIVQVMVRPGGNAGTYTNTAEAYSLDVPDPTLGDNTATADYVIEARADVTVTKTATPDPVGAGQEITYVIAATNINLGLSRAENVTITDTLPAGLTFVSATPSSGSCGTTPGALTTTGPASNNEIICNLGNLFSGAQRTVTIVMRPNFTEQGTTITNVVDVVTDTTEIDLTNNSAMIGVGVSAPDLDILVNKVDTVDPVALGEDTEYVITVSNAGPSAGQNIVVMDTLPTARLSFQSVSIPSGNGACSIVPAVDAVGGMLQCEFPYLLPGLGNVEEIRVTMRGVEKGSIVNSVAISSDEIAANMGYDRIAGNNLTTENTTVRTRTDIELVSKIPDSPTVNVNDNFFFTALVRVNAGPGLFEADDVMLSDTLPAGMVLTGTPVVTVLSGSASETTCTPAGDNLSFTCDLGTVAAGSDVSVQIPVEVVTVTALPQSFTNTARVTTTSLDVDTGDNEASGTVSVNSSSLSGTVFRDFADDSDVTAGDTGIEGITMMLTGTSFDGQPISLTTTTDANGFYEFPFIPQGTYTVMRGVVAEPQLTQGTNSVGQTVPATFSGDLLGNDKIEAIELPSNTAAFEYDFAFIPQASVGIAKVVSSGPVIAADGSFTVGFALVVENLGLEDLVDVDVTDQLSGAAPLFGTNVAPTAGAMALGTYSVSTAPGGSCGGLVPGFNGAGTTDLVSGTSLAVGASCTITYSLRVMPTGPLPPVVASGGRYNNQAVVTAEGALSGQTSATNPSLTDLSDDGVAIDGDNDRDAGDVGEDDPTPVIPVYDRSIALVKAADRSGLSDPAAVGEELTYSFAVHNTGNVTLTNVTVTDPLPGLTLVGGPITLTPGQIDTVTFTGSYDLTADDIAAGFVINQATVTGDDPFGDPVTDLSGITIVDDFALTTSFEDAPAIGLIKVANDSAVNVPAQVGDVITYQFRIINTGNVALTDVTLTDLLPDLMLMGSPIPVLMPAGLDQTTYSASYALTAADIAARAVNNTADVTGTYAPGMTVTSSSSTTVTLQTIDAVSEVFPPITGDGGTTTCILASDTINGEPATLDNVIITVIRIDDGLTLDPGTCTLTLSPGFPAGEYQIEYQITSIEDGSLIDTAIETVVQGAIPAIEVMKTQTVADNGDGVDGLGDVITYTILVTNTGNIALSDVVVVDTLTDLDGAALTLTTGPDFVSASDGSEAGDIGIGETETYTATFVINAQAVAAGGTQNSVTATGTDGTTNVTDLSDDGNDNDGDTESDSTDLILTSGEAGGALTITKTTPSEIVQRGAVVPYTITLTNGGAVAAGPMNIIDTLPDGFLYVQGSALLNGAAASVTVEGGRVIWSGVNVPAGGEVIASLSARILNGTDAGTHVNQVRATDPTTGETIAGIATAIVRIIPEAVFDCGEVVGRVFTDLDGDGYQDAPGGADVPVHPSGITDQTFDDGKGDPVPEAPRNEVGIPGVRLATVDGLIITTDQNGLFSVPCAALPADGGSNFILKLDDRSLPAGYRLTTENPRVMRLTPGMVTEMNFGATIGRVIRVDLSGAAFFAGDTGAQMQPALVNGIAAMLAQMGDEPTNIRLAFHVPTSASGATVTQARGLMDMVEDEIDRQWREVGGRSLRVEQLIVRGDQ